MKHKDKQGDYCNRTQGLSEHLCEEMQPKKMQPLPAEITNFRDLPDEAHIRMPVMKVLYACSESTIWRGVKKNLIPAPHHLATKVTCWNVGKIRAALAKHA